MKKLLLVFLLFASPLYAQDHTPEVAAVKAALLARGMDLSGPCGSFAITSRVARIVMAEGWGLIASGGNGCDVNGQRYRADTLMKTDGTTIDLLGRSENDNGDTSNPANYNLPQWAPTGAQSPGNWRAPILVDEPAPVPVPVPIPVPQPVPIPPQPPPDSSLRPILESLAAHVVAIEVKLEAVSVSLEEHRRSLRGVLMAAAKYLGPIVGGIVAGLQIGP